MLSVKGKFGAQKVDILLDQLAVAAQARATREASSETVDPGCLFLRLLQDIGVSLLQHLVDCYQRLECLDLVGEDGLPRNE